jgi:hypothetical protein
VGGPALGRAGGGVPNLTETGDADAAGNSLPKLFLVRERPCECMVRLGVRASRVGDCATPRLPGGAARGLLLRGCCQRRVPRQKSSSSGEAVEDCRRRKQGGRGRGERGRGDTSLPPDARGALAEAEPRAGGGGACWGGGGAESV